MLGSTHFIAGAAIGKLSGNPVLAIVLGFLFHFIQDLVPHFDYGYFFKKTVRSFAVAISDPFVGLIVWVLIGLLVGFDQQQWINSFLGGAACIAPDVFSVFIKLFKIEKLKKLNIFHARVHWFIKEEYDVFEWKKGYISKKGIILGLIYQIPFIVVSLWFLIK
uniref:Uncharacterized protein n=1 Tax=candidate division CPR3 bacterium TaxID=2268181 RepID=A0A7C4R570_UNCC3